MVQEYYESSNDKLNSKSFSLITFIDEFMDDSGDISYWRYWNGYNIPGSVYMEWHKSTINPDGISYLSEYESLLFDEISKYGHDDCYIIGCLEGDSETIDHELSHAMFYLNPLYRKRMEKLLYTNLLELNNNQYYKIRDTLRLMGYSDEVIPDEIIAYLSTSKKKELREDFGLNTDKLEKLINKFRKVFTKYKHSYKS